MSFHMVNVTVAPKLDSLRLSKNDGILEKPPKMSKKVLEKNEQNLSNFCLTIALYRRVLIFFV